MSSLGSICGPTSDQGYNFWSKSVWVPTSGMGSVWGLSEVQPLVWGPTPSLGSNLWSRVGLESTLDLETIWCATSGLKSNL